MTLPNYRIIQNYVITYLLIGFSDITFFDANRIGRMGFLLLLGILFFYYNKKIRKDLFILMAVAIYLILFQTLYFGGGKLFTTATLIGLLIVLPYFAIKLIGPQFLKYYRDVMVVITVISIGFWIAVNLSSGLHSASQGWAQTLGAFYKPEFGVYNDNYIIYTYEAQEVYGFIRNPGPFHEPGAFSVFLMLAIISEIFITGKMLTRNNLFFFTGLITTFSTAGFLGLFIIVTFYVYSSNRMTLLTKFFVSGTMLALIIYLFMTLEFLGDKISSQMEEQTETQINTPTAGRFLGARKALIVLYRYPLFGRGFISASQAALTSDEAAGYGWIRWVSRIGVIFGIIYLFFLYKALRNYSIINLHSKLFAVFAFGAMLAVLSGQKHTSSLVFFTLFLTPIIFPVETYWRDYVLKVNKSKKSKNTIPKRMTFEDYGRLAKIGEKNKLTE